MRKEHSRQRVTGTEGEECKAEEGEHLVFLRTSEEANYWGRVGEEENEGRGEARATAGDRWPKP